MTTCKFCGWETLRCTCDKPTSKYSPMNRQKAWTDADVHALRSLWAQGYSGSEISAMIGKGFTRCAVLGKLNRLGIKREKRK